MSTINNKSNSNQSKNSNKINNNTSNSNKTNSNKTNNNINNNNLNVLVQKNKKKNIAINTNDLENNENNNLNQKFDEFVDNANKTIKNSIKTTKKTFDNIKEEGDTVVKNIDNTLKATFKLPTMENKLETIKSSKNENNKKDEKDENKIKKTEKESLDSMYKGNMFSKIIGVLIITVLLIALIYAGSEYYKYKYLNIMDSDKIVILEGIHDGSNPKLISQNPKYKSSIAINKSDNRSGGMEFTYSFWIMINGTKAESQHIFHKGDKFQMNRTPGVYLEPNKNVMKFYFNISKPKDVDNDLLKNLEQKNIEELRTIAKKEHILTSKKDKTQLINELIYNKKNYETIEIANLPLKKWINITFTFIEGKKPLNNNFNILSIYINGLLKKSKYLSSLPILNNHDLHLTRNGGFDGYLGNMYYYAEQINKEEIFKLVEDCPKNIGCGIDADCPPYLDNNWWFT